MSQKVSNVFEAILKYGDDEDFVPLEGDTFAPTDAPAVTLVTCYPFYFVGSAPQRFIVRATTSTRAGP